MEWHLLIGQGIEFHTGPLVNDHELKRRLAVRKIQWKKPGFSGKTSKGWIVELDGERIAGAFETAKKAREWAELPGTPKP
jgi:hypothetical protein